MKLKDSLYTPFKHWAEGGSVYITSDPHFSDGAPYNYYDNENDSIQSWIDKVKEVRQHFVTAADEDFWLEDISNEEFRIHEENREKELHKGFEELADIFWDLWD